MNIYFYIKENDERTLFETRMVFEKAMEIKLRQLAIRKMTMQDNEEKPHNINLEFGIFCK